MRNLLKVSSELETEYKKLKNEKKFVSEADKQRIIEEYKESPELMEKIIAQFAEGYQSHKERIKAKMLAADLDTTILYSSDEESKANDNPLHH